MNDPKCPTCQNFDGPHATLISKILPTRAQGCVGCSALYEAVVKAGFPEETWHEQGRLSWYKYWPRLQRSIPFYFRSMEYPRGTSAEFEVFAVESE